VLEGVLFLFFFSNLATINLFSNFTKSNALNFPKPFFLFLMPWQQQIFYFYGRFAATSKARSDSKSGNQNILVSASTLLKFRRKQGTELFQTLLITLTRLGQSLLIFYGRFVATSKASSDSKSGNQNILVSDFAKLKFHWKQGTEFFQTLLITFNAVGTKSPYLFTGASPRPQKRAPILKVETKIFL
jgi:glycosidase